MPISGNDGRVSGAPQGDAPSIAASPEIKELIAAQDGFR